MEQVLRMWGPVCAGSASRPTPTAARSAASPAPGLRWVPGSRPLSRRSHSCRARQSLRHARNDGQGRGIKLSAPPRPSRKAFTVPNVFLYSLTREEGRGPGGRALRSAWEARRPGGCARRAGAPSRNRPRHHRAQIMGSLRGNRAPEHAGSPLTQKRAPGISQPKESAPPPTGPAGPELTLRWGRPGGDSAVTRQAGRGAAQPGGHRRGPRRGAQAGAGTALRASQLLSGLVQKLPFSLGVRAGRGLIPHSSAPFERPPNHGISLGRNKCFVLGWLPSGAWGRALRPHAGCQPTHVPRPLRVQGASSQCAPRSPNTGSCLPGEETQIFPHKEPRGAAPEVGDAAALPEGPCRDVPCAEGRRGAWRTRTRPGRLPAPRAVRRHPRHTRRTRANTERARVGNGRCSASCPAEKR